MIRTVPARWRGTILVCGKCEKKLGKGGFGPDGDKRLSRQLRAAAGDGKGRKAGLGVVTTKCLKLCPKRAVTVVDAARPRDWLVVAEGTPWVEIEARLGAVLAAEPAAAG